MTKKAARPPRRLMITKNLILMLVVVVIVFLAVFAWYYENRSVTASGTTVSAAGPTKVQIAVPTSNGGVPADSAFTDNLDFGLTNFVDDMFNDVTSDGQRFLIPEFMPAEDKINGRQVLPEGEWVAADSSKKLRSNDKEEDDNRYHYISFDFYLRSSEPDIYLRSESFLAAASETEKTAGGANNFQPLVFANKDSLSADAKTRVSSFGNDTFSADGIVGAMRVSLIGNKVTKSGDTYTDGTKAIKLLWLPRPDLLLTPAANDRDWRLGFVKETDAGYATTGVHKFYAAADESTITYQDGEEIKGKGVTETTYSVGGSAPSYFKVSKLDNNRVGHTGYVPTLGTSVKVAENNSPSDMVEFIPTGESEGESYYLYKFTMNIWIEGADTEARRAMNTGKFWLKVIFGAEG